VGFFFFFFFLYVFDAKKNKVHRSFAAAENVPPVAFLQNSAFLEMLVDDLFITARELPAKYLDK
jgi:hypothetical protein